MKRYLFPLLLLPLLLGTACKREDPPPGPDQPGFVKNDMVLYWNDKIATVLGVGMNQPTRARLFAIMHIALHDALNSIRPKYQTYALNGRRESRADPDAAVAAAGYWVIKGMNRQGTFPLDTWYNESLATVADGPEKELGKVLGQQAAEAIVTARANDGFSQVLPTSLNPPNGTTPGAYRQTNANNVRFIPNWGAVVQPFVVTSNSAFRAPGPHPLGSPEYAADYNEVKEKGVRTGSTRTGLEDTLAHFWAENRPSIIWNNFTRSAIAGKWYNAWQTARLLAVLHTAMADGINTVMESKYHFYRWRPETAIQEGATDGNGATAAMAGWTPYLIEAPNTNPLGQFVSPPVPEYPSGFTMYGGVAGTVLQWFLDSDDVSVSFGSASLPGSTMQYASITQAVLDNTEGKIHAGWYFRKSAEDGQYIGSNVAAYVIGHHFLEN